MSRSYPSMRVPIPAATTGRRDPRLVVPASVIHRGWRRRPGCSRGVTRLGDPPVRGLPGDPGRYPGAGGEAELAQDVGDVAFRGALRDDQLAGDVLVAQSAPDQGGDLLFPPGQRLLDGPFPLRCGLGPAALVQCVRQRLLLGEAPPLAVGLLES